MTVLGIDFAVALLLESDWFRPAIFDLWYRSMMIA